MKQLFKVTLALTAVTISIFMLSSTLTPVILRQHQTALYKNIAVRCIVSRTAED